MIKTRIYHPGQLKLDTELKLESQAAVHVSKVLRMKAGQAFLLFNGNGSEYVGEIIASDRHHTTVKILHESAISRESPLAVHIGQGLSKGEKMDFTIQKAVELGVDKITPLITQRSNFQLKADRIEKRMKHWQAIIISACEQCGRNQLPTLYKPVTIQSWLQQIPGGELNLTLHPDSNQCLNDINYQNERINILIGPEGGLNEDELGYAENYGFKSVRLGPRVLRTESAALTILSIIQNKWGDL